MPRAQGCAGAAQLKTPYRDGTTHVVSEALELMARIPVRHPADDLRSSRLVFLPICHGAAGGAGAAAAGESDPLPRAVCAFMPFGYNRTAPGLPGTRFLERVG